MKITFGLALDGFRPSTPAFNQLYCGPLGLVSVMELRLGLTCGTSGTATRVRQHLEALEDTAATRKCFFSDSLGVDRWGSAAALLKMRDELRMAGWGGNMMNSAPQRLKDLAEVEQRGRGCLAAGLADRLAKLRDEIATRSPKISEIQCVEEAGHLPYLIRCLLETLGARFTCGPAIEAADPGTNLRLVQDFLRGCDISGASWNGLDESVVLASAFGPSPGTTTVPRRSPACDSSLAPPARRRSGGAAPTPDAAIQHVPVHFHHGHGS